MIFLCDLVDNTPSCLDRISTACHRLPQNAPGFRLRSVRTGSAPRPEPRRLKVTRSIVIGPLTQGVGGAAVRPGERPAAPNRGARVARANALPGLRFQFCATPTVAVRRSEALSNPVIMHESPVLGSARYRGLVHDHGILAGGHHSALRSWLPTCRSQSAKAPRRASSTCFTPRRGRVSPNG